MSDCDDGGCCGCIIAVLLFAAFIASIGVVIHAVRFTWGSLFG